MTMGKEQYYLETKKMCQKIALSRYQINEVYFTAVAMTLYLFTKAVLWIYKSKLVRQWGSITFMLKKRN